MRNVTKLVKCSCHHEYQDKKYGGLRVTTPKNKEQEKGIFVVYCTVCGKEHIPGNMPK